MLPDTFTRGKLTTPARARGCLTCTDFHGRYYCGHVVCERTSAVHVIGSPAMGCAFWTRERQVDEASYNVRMPSTREPFARPEHCPVVQMHVIVSGVRVSLGSESVITAKMSTNAEHCI